MRKSGPKSFYHKEEMPIMPPREPEEKETQLARWEYQRLENELSDIYHRTMDVLENLNKSNPSEYSRLANIIENALDELRIRIHQKAVLEFPELTHRKKEKPQSQVQTRSKFLLRRWITALFQVKTRSPGQIYAGLSLNCLIYGLRRKRLRIPAGENHFVHMIILVRISKNG